MYVRTYRHITDMHTGIEQVALERIRAALNDIEHTQLHRGTTTRFPPFSEVFLRLLCPYVAPKNTTKKTSIFFCSVLCLCVCKSRALQGIESLSL